VNTIPRIQENESHLYEYYVPWRKCKSQDVTNICSTKEMLLIEKGNRYHTNYKRDNRFGWGIQVIKIIS